LNFKCDICIGSSDWLLFSSTSTNSKVQTFGARQVRIISVKCGLPNKTMILH